ncbi:mCpol domain-containing protein [Sphingobacterium faecium]|uniref:mCpol domain-containing protein n=1 Tax=Sphingobacterium faecium TaxID=34087 RepID=UPI003DA3125A
MEDLIFIRLDGDKIGDKIELFLLNNDWISAQDIHNKIQKGIESLVKYIKSIESSQLLMVGCDDILFTIKRHEFNLIIVQQIQKIFFNETQFTLSIGIGNSSIDAIHNLRKAKLSGRNKIILT